MSKLISDDGRTHVKSTLMRESLQNRGVLAGTDSDRDLQILPNVSLVSVGGQSIFDRGADAIRQVADEIAEGKKTRNIVVGVGGGTRVRHTASIALDLGLPVGGIAQLVGAMEELNAVVLTAVLAKHNSIPMQRDHFWDLPLYFNAGMIPICISVPPYHLWEPPPESGHLPAHGSDFGLFQLSEVLAFEQVIFVKDEDGLYDKDPKKHDDARLIPKATLAELVDETGHCKLEESIIDKVIFWAWHQARNVKRIQIVNGLKKGELTRALAGEDNGTVITKE